MRADSAFQAPVAVLLPALEAGGHEYMLFEWLRAASKVGLCPTIYARGASEPAEMARRCGFAHVEADYRECIGPHRRCEMAVNVRVTLEALKRISPAVPILLAPGAMQTGLSHLAACLWKRRKVTCYVPNTHPSAVLCASKPWARDTLTQLLGRRVANWIVITPQQAKDLRTSWRLDAPVTVVPNRLELLDAVPPLPPRVRLIKDGRLTALFAGRFEPAAKGLDWLVRVIAQRADLNTTRFVFQGRGSYENDLEALARLSPTGTVEVRPWGPVGDGLQHADLLLLSSRFEGFPLVAVEAIHAGVPVVATRQSGLTDVLPGEALVDFGDDAALMAAVDGMRDPVLRLHTVEHARARLDCLLSRDVYAQAVCNATIALRTLGAGI